MRKYGKIETGFWRNPKVRALSDDGKLLLAYLFSCPHANALGCFVLPMAYIADDMKWSVKKSAETLSELLSNGFVTRDEACDLILIRGWWGHNTVENPNVAKSIIAAVKALPKSELKQLAIQFLKLMANCSETVSKLFAEQFRNPEPEPEPKPEPKPETEETRADARLAAKEDFKKEFEETFWPAYPVHEGKKPALAAFMKARAKASLEIIMAGVERYGHRLQQPNAPSPKWPQGWLNDERWNDEPTKATEANGRHGLQAVGGAKRDWWDVSKPAPPDEPPPSLVRRQAGI